MQKARGQTGRPKGLAFEADHRPPTACRQTVSGTISLPSPGYFSPFPHGTGSLSVSKEYLAFEGGPPIFEQDFTCPALLNTCLKDVAYGAVTVYGQAFQPVLVHKVLNVVVLQPQLVRKPIGLG